MAKLTQADEQSCAGAGFNGKMDDKSEGKEAGHIVMTGYSFSAGAEGACGIPGFS